MGTYLDMLNSLKKNPDSWVLFIVGLISELIGFLNIKELEGVILFSVGLICISISIERFLNLKILKKN
jgi:hypothetical protein